MTDTNAMREGIDKLRRDQAERCAHAEYHRGYDYALTDVLAWLDCALLATGRAAGVGEVERWAKFVEEYCHEPYGYRRENVCCAATACDIAGAMREAVSPVNEIAQIMNANSQDIKFSPVLPHPSSDFLYRPTEPPVYPGRSDASPPAPADASDFSPHRWTEIISNGLGANNAGCWRCGALSEVLARVLSLSGHDAKVIQGKANGEDHVWVQIGDTVYDPTVGQFQEPVSYQMDQVAPADASGEVDPDVRHRLLEVAKTLDAAKGNAFALNFHQLAHDIRAALNPTAGEK